jgi:hypothetical protein
MWCALTSLLESVVTFPPLSRRPGDRPPAALGYSLTLGLIFALAWLGYAAVRARDGRTPVTDWLDPLLAGATLGINLLAITVLIVVWPAVPTSTARATVAILLVTSQWIYVTGELLSNTITIGEPPGDVGGLLEIASGAMTGVGLLGLAYVAIGNGRRPGSTNAITALAVALAAATAWWFTHPIDQSTTGAPPCVPGNPLYNLTRGTDC